MLPPPPLSFQAVFTALVTLISGLTPFRPLPDLFRTLRLDIAILTPSCPDISVLTVCHETNIIKSNTFKESKYADLHLNSNDSAV